MQPELATGQDYPLPAAESGSMGSRRAACGGVHPRPAGSVTTAADPDPDTARGLRPCSVGARPDGRHRPGERRPQAARGITRPIRSTPCSEPWPSSPVSGSPSPHRSPIILRRPAGIKAATASLRDGLRPGLTPSTRHRGGPRV